MISQLSIQPPQLNNKAALLLDLANQGTTYESICIATSSVAAHIQSILDSEQDIEKHYTVRKLVQKETKELGILFACLGIYKDEELVAAWDIPSNILTQAYSLTSTDVLEYKKRIEETISIPFPPAGWEEMGKKIKSKTKEEITAYELAALEAEMKAKEQLPLEEENTTPNEPEGVIMPPGVHLTIESEADAEDFKGEIDTSTVRIAETDIEDTGEENETAETHIDSESTTNQEPGDLLELQFEPTLEITL